ncbi:MAG: ThuA domain-containing protein [Imperialibacter sp.]|uniref:ThuA domain-containing protein n=1 Tax=Imperialibacter sp. TaxID=2038411 RepID=UPI003A838960
MKHPLSIIKSLFLVAFLSLTVLSCSKKSGPAKVLVFSKTAGWHHTSIPFGIAAIQKLGIENGFEVDTTTNADYFNEDSLKNYSAVVFLSTTGDVLNHYQQADFERYIQAGGGYMGIHAAADTEYDWPWYGRLVGGYFLDHPGINDKSPNVQEGVLNIVDKSHPSTSFLPEKWTKTDEFYSYRNLNPNTHVVMTIDEDSYEGGAKIGNHPMAWYHDYDGGRAYYTALGHTDESYTEELYLKHILAGIRYAIGDNSELDYSKATSLRAPEENRFTKTMLAEGGVFYEPTEMTILPNFDILIAQRRGEILLYKNSTGKVTEAAKLDVYHQSGVKGVNAEEGVLGIQKDPNFATNNNVFIFYSPKDTSVNRLSRFKFVDDKIDVASEKVVLQFYSQRGICCHTGGSIAFDKDGLLYVSAGDNSTPFNEPGGKYVNNGFGPLDDRPGHEQYDARRSSGNADDLRGKIMRIRVNEDGSYEIPEGNLYPVGTEGTRPEIYVQGNRNPYRISVDQKTGFLYWGEVGPDAANDSMEVRGTRGYDELNQARKAGNFGWPMFVGKNYPYREYDYATGKSGELFDPEHPVNNSRNNTGIKELPPVAPPFIWYPYAASKEFPQVATGGRNAMAGPVYYTDMFPAATRYPDYYNGKLFIYDWIRGWIKAVTMYPNGDYEKMEPFMEHTKFNSLIDMEVGPDGKFYLLEYGNGWFAKNADAALSRVDFNGGNRAPSVEQIAVNKSSGTLPLEVTVTAKASDPERDKLSYTWDFGNGETKQTTVPEVTYTYSKIGDYAITVEASDPAKLTAKSNSISVYAGNAAPDVTISVKGNKSFYFPGKNVEYAVSVSDSDDSSEPDMASLFVSADYIESTDQAEATQGHQVISENMIGKNMMNSLDCKACHKEAEKSIGPAYMDVAKRYKDDPDAISKLAQKVMNGGSGVWGETAMAAHPGLSESDAKTIVSWVLSLADGGKTAKSLPATGSLKPTLDKKPMDNGSLIIRASYTDKGGANIKPLVGSSTLRLRSSKLDLTKASKLDGYTTMSFNGMNLLLLPNAAGSFSLSKIDLTDVAGADFMTGSQQPMAKGYTFEVRLDAVDGKKIGEASSTSGTSSAAGMNASMFTINFEPVTDGKLHDLYIISKPNDGEDVTGAVVGITLTSK